MDSTHRSYSSISCYELCPYKYNKLVNEKIEVKKGYALARGSKIHSDIKAAIDSGKVADTLFNTNPSIMGVADLLQNSHIEISEEKMSIKLGAHEFVGIADVVAVIKNERYIIDWKSGRDRGIQPHMHQLNLYANMVECLYNKKVNKVAIYYVDEGQLYEAKFEDGKKQETICWAIGLMQKIEGDKKFEKKRGEYCRWCDVIS